MQKKGEVRAVLTEGLGRLICAAQGTGGEVRAALGRSSAAGSKQGLSGLLDGTARPQGCPAGRIRGQGGSGAIGGEKKQWRCLPAAAILAEGCGGAGGSGVGLWARCRWDAQGDAGWSLKKRAR